MHQLVTTISSGTEGHCCHKKWRLQLLVVTGCHVQVSQVRSELSAANAAAAKEAKRSAALQQDLEHLQEQATRAAVNTVDELVGDLTQGQETEDDSEQPAQQQRLSKAGGTAAGKRAAAAAAKREQGRAGGKPAGAVAATPVAQAAVFNAGPAAQLSEIEEGDEELGEDEEIAQQLAAENKPQPRKHQQQQDQQQEASGGGRRPRSAKVKAQQHIKAAAAADVTPPGAAAADEDAEEPGRRVSPRTK
jgi:hypothetical protein